ncbi:MAG: AtpZ/AtpI family protein [Steroidobacteraceae bacterium]|jgi:ATP synthase protein I
MSPEPQERDRFGKAVKQRQERLERWQRDGERSPGQNLAMIGALGSAIVVPILLGIFAGRWLDRKFHTGLWFTLGLLVVGLVFGCVLAWRRIRSE